MQRLLVAAVAITTGTAMLIGAPYAKAAGLRYLERSGSDWRAAYARSLLNTPGYVPVLRLFGLAWLLAGLLLAMAKDVSPK